MTGSAPPPAGSRPSQGEWLRTQRQARGWSVPEMRRHLRNAAQEAGDTLPGNDCIRVMIRRWEKDEGGVSERYRMHYCRAFRIPLDSFGTAPLPTGANVLALTEAQVTAVPPAPLDDDERAELIRLRRRYAELHARHRNFKRDLLTWMRKALDQDKDWDLHYPHPDIEL